MVTSAARGFRRRVTRPLSSFLVRIGVGVGGGVVLGCSGFSTDCGQFHTCSTPGAPDAQPTLDARPAADGTSGAGGNSTGGTGGTLSSGGSTSSGGTTPDSGAPRMHPDAAAPVHTDAGDATPSGAGDAGDAGVSIDAGHDASDGGLHCAPGLTDCNGDPIDGCEANLATMTTNCGACKHTCSTAGGTSQCVSGVCKPTCDPTHANCDLKPENGCESDLTTAKTCGACGRDCEGGACVGGQCQPFELIAWLGSPIDLVADATYLHFTEAGTTARQLERVPVHGGLPVQVADNTDIENLTTDGKYVYFSRNDGTGAGTIVRVQSGASAIELVRGGIQVTGRIAADTANVYWLDYQDNTVYQAAPTPVATPTITIGFANSVGDMRSDGARLFVSSGTTLFSASEDPKNPGATVVTDFPALDLVAVGSSLAVDATHVYSWLATASGGGSAPYHLIRLDKAGLTNPLDLTTAPGLVTATVAAGNAVYFLQGDNLYRVSASVAAQKSVLVSPNPVGAIAAANGAVYWTEAGATAGVSILEKVRFYQ
jgi:hypothetical protein